MGDARWGRSSADGHLSPLRAPCRLERSVSSIMCHIALRSSSPFESRRSVALLNSVRGEATEDWRAEATPIHNQQFVRTFVKCYSFSPIQRLS